MIKHSDERKAEVHVHSNSVLCLGKLRRLSEAISRWMEQIQCFQQANEYEELSGIDGQPI